MATSFNSARPPPDRAGEPERGPADERLVLDRESHEHAGEDRAQDRQQARDLFESGVLRQEAGAQPDERRLAGHDEQPKRQGSPEVAEVFAEVVQNLVHGFTG